MNKFQKKEKNFKTDIYKESLIILTNTEHHPSTKQKPHKLAIFDLDNTLIKTKGFNQFPKNQKDWKFLYKKIPEKLKELHKKKYLIFIISNQLGIGLNYVDKDLIIDRIINSLGNLEIPFFCLLSTEDDFYRKPSIGCFDYIKSQILMDFNFDQKDSFFCGDAAGRKCFKTNKNDFSNSDVLFAKNCNLNFFTPENFFLGIKDSLPQINFFGINKFCEMKKDKFFKIENINKKNNSRDVFFVIGPPSSGKTCFIEKNLPKNNFYLKIKKTYYFEIESLKINLKDKKEKKIIIIETLGTTKRVRQILLKTLKKYKTNIYCINLKFPKEVCFHLNHLRKFKEINRFKRNDSICKKLISSYYKQFEQIESCEGFCKVFIVSKIQIDKDCVNNKYFFFNYY